MATLIAGCGDIGSLLGKRLLERGQAVYGIRRSIDRLPAGITPVAADLTQALPALPEDIDQLVYLATPGARNEAAYRSIYIDAFRRLLGAFRKPLSRLIMVSSTAVYGQSQGQWVDETCETLPKGFNGRILLEAEQLVKDAAETSVVVRFSGIYGPGRDFLLRKLAAGSIEVQAEPPYITNRIHRADAAAVLDHVLAMGNPDNLYIGTDDKPVARHEFYQWLAKQMGLPEPVLLSTAADEAVDQGKAISNQRIKASGFSFQYPDFRSGYRTMLNMECNNDSE